MTSPSSPPRPTVALLGAGTMGAPMGRNILRAGLPLQVWNRSRDKAEALAEAGATVAASPGDAVTGADVIVTMLFDLASVEDVIGRAQAGCRPGATWLQMSTVGVEGAARLGERARQLGLVYVDAPVLGTRKPAEDGALVVLASGPEAAEQACRPVFDAVGSRIMWVGEAGAGSRLKLAANAFVLAVLEGVAESLTLTRRLGLDPQLFLQAVEGGAMNAPYVQLKGRAMLDGDFTPAFALGGAAKDAGLILDAARIAGVEMGVTEAAERQLRRAVDLGHADQDMAAIYLSR